MPAATHPGYYGQIMVASALGDAQDIRVVPISLSADTESAYGIYNDDNLANIVVVKLRFFDSSSAGSRPECHYRFQVGDAARQAQFERLMAPGCYAAKEVTFGGVSYDYSNLGKSKTVHSNEMVDVTDGIVDVDVPDSSAVLLTLV